MKLIEVGLLSPNLEAQRQFYTETLGLPLIAGDAGSFAVQAGQTRLSFRAAASQAGPYHLAFDVLEHRFADAAGWIGARVPLLSEGSQDTFFSPNWNADMLYFTDPCGNILELIARHTLPRPQHAGLLVNVSEVGVAVPNVLDTVERLRSALSVGGYGEGSASFSPVGTHAGLFIVVQEKRPWFPTAQAAVPLPVSIVAQTPRSGTVTLPTGPVQIIGVIGP
ncbi:hypothetical protein [Deinococcus sp.]|uniref:VOC family protein n=1 Tax=Deinococcus sp. TaxID=47478 RepID=UPI00286E3C13|nr:hypothetical protein [Deinococcus sp.]